MKLDHFVLTVKSIEKTIQFYQDVLGAKAFQFGQGRWALKIGSQKINLHEEKSEISPHARKPTPGSADLCFISEKIIPKWETHLQKFGVTIELGPVQRTGATGGILSIYLYDPDGNLLEISNKI